MDFAIGCLSFQLHVCRARLKFGVETPGCRLLGIASAVLGCRFYLFYNASRGLRVLEECRRRDGAQILDSLDANLIRGARLATVLVSV